MKPLTEAEVIFKVECLGEDSPIKGNVLVSGDAEEDRKAEEWAFKQLQGGNAWAWCTIRVVACWEGFEGDDYLGCCSYKSKVDFMQPGDYYDDMKKEALKELNDKVEFLFNILINREWRV